MSYLIKYLLLTLLVLASLSACALFQDEKKPDPEPVKVVEKKAELPKPPPVVTREPGAIWAENSKWNDLFSESSTRSVGDVVFIKPSDQFKALLSNRPDRLTQSASDYVNAAAHESNQIVVRIKEILPQGIYNVEGDQNLKVRGRAQKISLSGKIRERDIATDDTAPSDAIFDMNLEVNGTDPDAERASVAANDERPSNNVADRDAARNAPKNLDKDKTKEGDLGTKVSNVTK